MVPCVHNGVFASLELSDGSDPPMSIELDAQVADFNLSGLGDGILNEVSAVENKGRLLGLAPGSRIFPQVSFSVYQLDVLSHATKETAQAFVLGLPPFEARKSTSCAGGAGVTLNAKYKIATPDGPEVIECGHVNLGVDSYAEGDPNSTWSLAGPVYGEVKINGDVAASEYKVPSSWKE